MRIHYSILTMIGLCVAALGAWLAVSLLNEFAGGGTDRDATLAATSADAPDAERFVPRTALDDANDRAAAGGAAGALGTPTMIEPSAANEPSGGGVATSSGSAPDREGSDKEMDRLEQNEPNAPPPRILPREAGPFRAAFIREPPTESEFPVIRLGEVMWRVETHTDGIVMADLEIVAADQGQRATLRLGGGVAAGDAVFIVTLLLGEGEFLPDDGDVMIDAITARGRGDRVVRIPAINLPFEDRKAVDFRVPAEEMLASLNFASWLDVGLRIGEARYTITIQNGGAIRDILSAVAFGN